jgi:carbonic anhydrase
LLESTQEIVVCLKKFVMVQFHHHKERNHLVEGGEGVEKDSG